MSLKPGTLVWSTLHRTQYVIVRQIPMAYVAFDVKTGVETQHHPITLIPNAQDACTLAFDTMITQIKLTPRPDAGIGTLPAITKSEAISQMEYESNIEQNSISQGKHKALIEAELVQCYCATGLEYYARRFKFCWLYAKLSNSLGTYGILSGRQERLAFFARLYAAAQVQ